MAWGLKGQSVPSAPRSLPDLNRVDSPRARHQYVFRNNVPQPLSLWGARMGRRHTAMSVCRRLQLGRARSAETVTAGEPYTIATVPVGRRPGQTGPGSSAMQAADGVKQGVPASRHTDKGPRLGRRRPVSTPQTTCCPLAFRSSSAASKHFRMHARTAPLTPTPLSSCALSSRNGRVLRPAYLVSRYSVLLPASIAHGPAAQ